MIARGILFIIIFGISCILIGDLLLRIIGWKRSLPGSYVWGLVTMLGIFQLVSYPMYRFGSSFMLLFWTYLAVLSLVLVCAVVCIVKTNGLRTYSDELRNTACEAKKCVFLLIILIVSLAVHFFMSEGFYYSSSDDGYYITKGMEAVSQNSLAINDDMAWFGRDNAPIHNFENGSTFPFFLAFLSYASGIQATILAKTFLLFNLIAAHLAAVATSADMLIEKRENLFQKKALIIIFYILFQLLAVKEGTSGIWMTGFLYEGKSILVALVFPLLLSSCFMLLRRIDEFKEIEWLSVAMLLLAGVEVSVIGVIFPAILYFCLGIAILISKKFRCLSRVWLPALAAAIPAIVFALLSYYSAASVFFRMGGISTGDYVSAETAVNSSMSPTFSNHLTSQLISWKDHFLYATDFWQFVLYAFAVIYVIIRGTENQKTVFVLYPLVLLLTFANPFISDFVAARITTPIVYWRVFWLFPTYLLPAIIMSDIFDRLTEGKLQNGLIGSILILGIIGGFELFRYSVTAPEYSVYPFVKNIGKLINVRPELRHGNLYNLNASTLDIAETIENDWNSDERPRLLFCFNRPFEIRQYSVEFEMVSEVRNYHTASGNVPGTDMAMREFIQTYSEIDDPEFLSNALKALNVDYICFANTTAAQGLEEYGLKRVSQFGAYDIWKRS